MKNHERLKINVSIQKSMGQIIIAKNEWNILSNVCFYDFAKFLPFCCLDFIYHVYASLCVYSYRSIHNIPIYINILNGRSIFILVLFLAVSLHQYFLEIISDKGAKLYCDIVVSYHQFISISKFSWGTRVNTK